MTQPVQELIGRLGAKISTLIAMAYRLWKNFWIELEIRKYGITVWIFKVATIHLFVDIGVWDFWKP